ncbi:MAG: hypothetical protein AB7F08_06990 [Dongiaceae bacterium]
MFESFFKSLVDGRAIYANDRPIAPSAANDDPLALDVAVTTYKLIEKIGDLAARFRRAPANDAQPRALGCG